jgi:hypothetical protein
LYFWFSVYLDGVECEFVAGMADVLGKEAEEAYTAALLPDILR